MISTSQTKLDRKRDSVLPFQALYKIRELKVSIEGRQAGVPSVPATPTNKIIVVRTVKAALITATCARCTRRSHAKLPGSTYRDAKTRLEPLPFPDCPGTTQVPSTIYMGFGQYLRELLMCLSLVAVVSYVTDLQLYGGVCIAIQWLSASYSIPNQTEVLRPHRLHHVRDGLHARLRSSWRSTLLTAFVWLWCVRLGSFLYLRTCKCGSDKRFADIIVNPLCFLAAWNIQGLWVFFTLLSVLLSITHGVQNPEVTLLDVVGTSLWIVGYVTEVTADCQKTQFRLNKRNQGQFIRTGLWGYSRHPNYFGEILMWIGVFLVAVHTLPSFAMQCSAAISPAFMALLIVFRSGIPLLEKQAEERWRKLKTYQEYKAQTNVLVPLPKSKLIEPQHAKAA